MSNSSGLVLLPSWLSLIYQKKSSGPRTSRNLQHWQNSKQASTKDCFTSKEKSILIQVCKIWVCMYVFGVLIVL